VVCRITIWGNGMTKPDLPTPPLGGTVTESNGIIYVNFKREGRQIEKLFKTVRGATAYIAMLEASRSKE
jgi:hypothetical protein